MYAGFSLLDTYIALAMVKYDAFVPVLLRGFDESLGRVQMFRSGENSYLHVIICF